MYNAAISYLAIAATLLSLNLFNYHDTLQYNYDPNTVDNLLVSAPPPNENSIAIIQVALLLDTSNSMDGLIDQAKSRLWNIVNTLTTLRYQGKEPKLEIALYEYGNDGLSAETKYIRQVAAFTTDLDLISEKLFSLTTNGGEEYCGAVIKNAISNLEWSASRSDMKLVYIAGNEPFNQGPIPYKESIASAREKYIYINTIFCGDRQEGVSTHWKDGADKGLGKFFNINSNKRIRYIETPYDARIDACNERLNNTYIGYGRMGESKKVAQVQQDRNAKSMSTGNAVERSITKSKKGYYSNSSWDLVDRYNNDSKAIDNMSDSDLPQELRGKSKEQLKQYIVKKDAERTAIQNEVATLSKQREQYIKEQSENIDEDADDLGNAITVSIIETATANGYELLKK